MSNWTRFCERLYARALRLYPREFRADFGDEMRAVFAQAIEAPAGTGQTLGFFLRELEDLPGSLLRQHWLAIRKEQAPMNPLAESNDIRIREHQPGTWGAAFLAGLPHLLMGLLIGLGKLGIFDVMQMSRTGNLIVGVGLALLVVGVLLYAWRRRWPLWSASWYLYGTWVSLVVISQTIESLDLEESWRYTSALFIGWILVCIVGYFVILSRSKLHGLLSVAFLFPLLSVLMLEFIPNPIEAWLALGVALLAALATGTIVRVGELPLALRLVLGYNLAVGLVWAYIGEYKMLDLPSGIPAHTPRFSNFLEMLALYCVFGLGIITLPFIFRSLWNFGRHRLGT
jgi:hypothetical protein